MAVRHCLPWAMVLAALTGVSASCPEDKKHICEIFFKDDDDDLDFLHSSLCCPEHEIQYPYTFLAMFFEMTDNFRLTFHWHEYYLQDTKVRVCERAYYDLHDEAPSRLTTENYCRDYYPERCLPYDLSLWQLEHLRRYKLYSFSVYLNITILSKPRPVLLPHDLYSGRPLFNITYEKWRDGERMPIVKDSLANLDMCSYNGYPELSRATTGEYVFLCRCGEESSGSKCEWGGGCRPEDLTTSCSGHGKCRYYREDIWCQCSDEYFGPRCEHHVSSAQPLRASADCRSHVTWCSDYCNWFGQCLCPPDKLLVNGTQCKRRALLMDVTVEFDSQQNTTLQDQARRLLSDSGIRVFDFDYHHDSMRLHFTVDEKDRSHIPKEIEWRAVLNSNISLSTSERDTVWIGPLNKSQEDNSLLLHFTIYAHWPVNVTWYKGQHHIFHYEIRKCHNGITKGRITVELLGDTDNHLCTIKFLVNNYEANIDWGEFSIEVSKGNSSTRQTVVVELEPPLMVQVYPHSITLQKNGSTNLTCVITGTWGWEKDFQVIWLYPESGGHFEVEYSKWNVSYLYIEHLEHSVSVSCQVKVWDFCSLERENGTGLLNSNLQRVNVTVQLAGTPFCPTQKDASTSVVWQETPVEKFNFEKCPDGFEGIARRKCVTAFDQRPNWAAPDYSSCVYHPLNQIIQRPTVFYLRRGYQVALDPNNITKEIQQILKEREMMFLPREYSVILEIFKDFFNLNISAIDLDLFLKMFQEIKKKMNTDGVWELHQIMRTYMRPEHSHNGSCHLDNLLLQLQDVVPQEGVTAFSMESQGHSKTLSLEVNVPEGDEKMVRVGALMYMDPSQLPSGVLIGATHREEEHVYGHELSGPAVEVVAVPTGQDSAFFNQNLTLNLSYFYTSQHKNVNEKCGGAEMVNQTLVWDLQRCSVLTWRRSYTVTQCLCHGQGLFALIKIPKIQTPETALKRPVVVAVACCGAVLLLLVFCICFLSSRFPVPPSWKCSMKQNDAAFECVTQMKNRITPLIPCFGASHEATPDPNSVEMVTCESFSSHTSHYLEPVGEGERITETVFDNINSSLHQGLSIECHCQGTAVHSKHYLDMANSQQISKNIKEWFSYKQAYERECGSSEPTCLLGQDSRISDSTHNEYIFPEITHSPVNVYVAEPDPGQSQYTV